MIRRHECPTCGRHYHCPRGINCGSPLVYDCFACYVSHHSAELEATSELVAQRFRLPDGSSGTLDLCFA